MTGRTDAWLHPLPLLLLALTLPVTSCTWPGESIYMRIGDMHHDSITARFAYPEEDRRTLFTILPTGELQPR